MAKSDKPSASDVAAKRRATNIKSAQGTYFLALLTTLIYPLRACLFWDFRFYFSLFVTEVLFKASHFTRDFDNSFSPEFLAKYADRIPTVLTWVLIAAIILLFLAVGLAAQKKPKLMLVSLMLYTLDTVALIVGRSLQLPDVHSPEGWIDVIFHAFVLFLLVVGVCAAYSREKPSKPQPVHSKKKKKKKKKH